MKNIIIYLYLIYCFISSSAHAETSAQYFAPPGCNVAFYKNLEDCKVTSCTTMVKSSQGDHMLTKDSILGANSDGRCHTIIETNATDTKTGNAMKEECYFRSTSIDVILDLFQSASDTSNLNFTWILTAAKMQQAMVLPPTKTSMGIQEDCNPKKWSKYSGKNPKQNSNSPNEVCEGLQEAVENCQSFICTKNGITVKVSDFNKRNRCLIDIEHKDELTKCKVKEEALSMLAGQITHIFVQPNLIQTFENYGCR